MITLDLSCLLHAAQCHDRPATSFVWTETRLHEIVDMKGEMALDLVLKLGVASTPPEHASKARQTRAETSKHDL